MGATGKADGWAVGSGAATQAVPPRLASDCGD